MGDIIHENLLANTFISSDALSENELQTLYDNSKLVKHKKKHILFNEGDFTSHIFLLKSGLVKLSKKLKSNRSLIINITTPGKFIGLSSQFSSGIYNYTATVIECCEIYYINLKTFNTILENNAKYAMSLMKIICNESLNVFNRVIAQNNRQLPGKLADLLLYFSEEIYHSSSFEFPLTRNELAEMAGTTKESLIRTLTEFKNDKIIAIEKKSIKLKSFEILKTLSKIG